VKEMDAKWAAHKKWCARARRDLQMKKIELIKGSGIYICGDALKKVLQEKYKCLVLFTPLVYH